jgi:hypothetical protein
VAGECKSRKPSALRRAAPQALRLKPNTRPSASRMAAALPGPGPELHISWPQFKRAYEKSCLDHQPFPVMSLGTPGAHVSVHIPRGDRHPT